MTTNHHTPIANGAAANNETFNAPLSELDTKLTDHETRIGDLEADMPVPSGTPTEYLDGEGNFTVPAGTGASVDGHLIKDEGVALPQRASIDFVGAGVTVTNEAGGTQVSIPGGGHIIQDEGADLATQPRLDFVGGGVTVTNDGGGSKTVVTIPNDHGGLSGLGDDDHPQYHDDARGDARYPRKYAGKTAAPTVNDDSGDGYIVGDRWLDETNDKEYVALDVSVGAAVWVETTGASSGASQNSLLNGGLDVAQRQAPATLTTIADNKYGPDRFRIARENADVQYQRNDATGESGLTSYYFGTLKKITNSGKFHFCQPIEVVDSLPLRGKAVTFQVRLKASASKNIRIGILELQNAGSADVIPATLVSTWNANSADPTLGTNLAVITSAVTCAVTTSWQLFSVTVTVPSNSKNILPAIWTDSQFAANDTLSIAELDLHTGSETQAWAPRPIAQEISLLRRYYFKTFPIDTAPAQNAGVTGAARFPAISAGATVMRLSLRAPVPLRTTPTVTTFNPSAANANPRDSNASVDCTIAASTLSPDCFFFNITGNASTLVGNAIDFHISADTEL